MKPYLILSIFIFLYILTLNTSVQCRPNHRYKNVKRHYHSGENKPHTITAEKAIERKYMDEKTAPCFQDVSTINLLIFSMFHKINKFVINLTRLN